MLGLIFIYFVGKAFYDLAAKYNQSKWGYGIGGVVSYYVGLLLGGFVLGIAIELFEPGWLETFSDTALGLMALPLGILACWGFYKFLENRWKQEPVKQSLGVLDENLPE